MRSEHTNQPQAKRVLRLAILTVSLMLASGAVLSAQLVVIINKDNANTVDKALLVEIYTGHTKLWKSGGPITSYDLPDDSPIRASFCEDLLGRSVSNMRALAAQNLFSGKAVPPKQAASDEEVKKAVGANKNAIGYIRASATDDSVKVILLH